MSPPSPVLRVLDPGPLTTVQDAGRPGYAHLGVPRSGALDRPAAALANRLVGNPEDAAVLETTLGGVGFEVSVSCTIAVTGAPCTVTVAGRAAPWGAAVSVPAGAPVAVGAAARGLRSYVAVAGGVLTGPVLGSRSTDTLSGLGPPPLWAGAELPVGAPATLPPSSDTVALPLAAEGAALLGVLPGPRLDWLAGDAWDLLTTATYQVTAESNRVGLRLTGPALERREDAPAELPSEGIVLGAVQVPPSGRPLVFLADHPTTGGYPVVAVVDPADLPTCAQLRPGDPVRLSGRLSGRVRGRRGGRR